MTTLIIDRAVMAGLITSALLALGGPVLLALWGRQLGAKWTAWAWGAATFFVFQIVLRLPWQIAVSVWLKDGSATAKTAWLVCSALTAGLFEETGRWVAYRFVMKERTSKAAIMLGFGHGGLESMLLVGLNLVGLVVIYAALGSGFGLGFSDEQRRLVVQQLSALTPSLALAGGVERLSTMTMHVGLSMLVFQGFVRGQRRWLWLAIGYHFLGNLLGVGAVKVLGPWGAEGVIGLFALGALWWTVKLHRRDQALRTVLAADAPPALAQGGAEPKTA